MQARFDSFGGCTAPPTDKVSFHRFLEFAREPVDAASTAVFRTVIGLLMMGEAVRWLGRGWIEEAFLAPAVLFKYHGFEWVAPLPDAGLHLLFVAIAVLAALVAAGLRYAVAVVGLCTAFAYVFLLNQAIYLNQYYLMLLCLLLLCVIPADREYSVRAFGLPAAGRTVPRWSVWALRSQFEVVLLYAGLVKLNPDWMAGQPLGLWFADKETELTVVSTWLSAPDAAVAASYAVVLLHLVGAPLLLWRRTRLATFCCYVVFHLANAVLLKIGLFPWITLAGTLMFFDPHWPRLVARRLGFASPPQGSRDLPPLKAAADAKPWVLPALAVFFLVQLLAPLGHLLYPGNVAWTSEGAMFGWRMKLDDRRGTAHFTVRDPATGRTWEVEPQEVLPKRHAERVATNPDLVLQFAHYLANSWAKERSVPRVEVRARVICSLNGREPSLLIDPQRDLAQVERTWRHYDWVLPLEASRSAAAPVRR